ncbi:hypothetical protein [Roseobacter sp. HKCCD8191]|nr:hypothetical protein [Roseobacter sp. HKCCD8191]
MTEKKADIIGLILLWFVSFYYGPLSFHLIENTPTFRGMLSFISSMFFVIGTVYFLVFKWGIVFTWFWNKLFYEGDEE